MAASPSMRNIQDNNISLIPTTVDYKKIEELYTNAISAMRKYSGNGDSEEDD